jgi:hypothetical protein
MFVESEVLYGCTRTMNFLEFSTSIELGVKSNIVSPDSMI